MKSITLFGSFFKESWQEVVKNFNMYMSCYIAFVLVDFLASVPWEGMGFGENSLTSIIMAVIVGIINLIIVVQVVLIEKSLVKGREKEKLLYAAPTYLIYTLYYTILFVIGLACLVVPGIIIAVALAMVPLASVLIDNDSVNYFKVSWEMAKKDFILMMSFVAASILTELVGIGFDLIPSWQIKFGVNIVYSFLDALILIVLTKTSVRTFYYLKKLSIGESVY